MSITATSKWLFLVTGFYAVACAPGILHRRPFQLAAVSISSDAVHRGLAVLASVLGFSVEH